MMSTYDATKPEDTGFLSEAPTELRKNFKGLKDDQIVDAALLKGLAPGNVNGQIPINNGVENENLNAGKLNGKTASDFAPKAHVHDTVTANSDGFMTATQNNKLANIAANAEVNQNAYSNVLVNGVTLQADSKTDTLEIVAGTNISIAPDATNDRITINVTGKVGSAATADTVEGVHASSFMRSDADAICTGRVQPTGGSGTAYSTAPLEIRTTATPRVGFHWPGVVASQIGMNNSGQVCVWNNPGTSYETFKAGTMYSFDKQVATTDLIPTSLPANGGTSDYCRYPHRLYRGGSDGEGENIYYVAPSWRTGQGWELKGYNNNSDEQANIHRVIVGYADNAGSVPWSGISDKPTIPSATGTRVWTSVGFAPGANSYQYATHNLNLDPTMAKAELLARCTIANNGYSIGDVLSNPTLYHNANFPTVVSVGLTANTVYFTSAALYLYIKHKTSAAALALPFTTGWELFFRIWY